MDDLYIIEGTNHIFVYRRHCDSDIELHRVFYKIVLDALWVIKQIRMTMRDAIFITCLGSFLEISDAILINPCLVVQAVVNPNLIVRCIYATVIDEEVVIQCRKMIAFRMCRYRSFHCRCTASELDVSDLTSLNSHSCCLRGETIVLSLTGSSIVWIRRTPCWIPSLVLRLILKSWEEPGISARSSISSERHRQRGRGVSPSYDLTCDRDVLNELSISLHKSTLVTKNLVAE